MSNAFSGNLSERNCNAARPDTDLCRKKRRFDLDVQGMNLSRI